MQIFTSLDDIVIQGGTAIALGNFDGIHIGHREILLNAIRSAKKDGLQSVCFTFSNHTRKNVSLICTEEEKMEILSNLGIDIVVNIPFNEQIKKMNPETFIEDILVRRLNGKILCCGFNYHYGSKASGDVDLLQRLSEKFGYEYRIAEPVYADGDVVSSTLVRQLIEAGEMERAAVCLGRNFYCIGQIVDGEHIGAGMGFPTANVLFESYRIAPPNGVYYTLVDMDGRKYPAITNVGVKPTIGNFSKLIESHLYGEFGNLYGKNVKVEFLLFVRPEVKFSSIDALKKQVLEDREAGRAYHEQEGRL